MAQLTELQIGTNQNDSFVGEFEIDATRSLTRKGIFDAVIKTLSGDDIVEGRVRLIPTVGELSFRATGIDSATIKTGSGDDIVIGKGFGARFFEGFNGSTPTYSGSSISFGIASSGVNTGNGNDVLTFSGISDDDGLERFILRGVGVNTSSINTGNGADTITVSGITAVEESAISMGGDQDTVIINAKNNSSVKGVDRSLIRGDGEADNISITAEGAAEAEAVTSARIVGGSGNDLISIAANSVGDGTFFSSLATGADRSIIQASSGEDVISLVSFADNFQASAIGANESRISGGSGSTTITLSGTSFGSEGQGIGASNSIIRGSSGDDVITMIGESTVSLGQAAGALESTIRGGSGDDTMRFIARSGAISFSAGAGIVGSSIFGDSGNDRFEVQVEAVGNGVEGLPSYGITSGFFGEDTLLSGGSGNDFFDVGIGDGKIKGGSGDDTAVVSYFDAETMSVEAITNGIRISGSLTNNGTAGEWQQDILGVESFVVGDIVYTAADFVAAFG